MCGIAGATGAIDDGTREAVRRATAAQTHRGPDGHGFWSSRDDAGPGAAFGHRRLAIIDLSERGAQPMHDPASGCVITYNGEVYNFRELRSELQQIGAEFQSDTDTEVILQAYVQWGSACVSRFHGMFAFAVWDPRNQSVFFARDRLGIKPLYFTTRRETDGRSTTFFASEFCALLAAGVVKRQIDPVGLASYFWNGFVVGPQTIACDVKLLPAGCTMQIAADGQPQEWQTYWNLPAPSVSADQSTAVEAVGDALRQSVGQRLISDVPLGVFLSGGTDSSAVAALAMHAAGGGVSTFNVAFDEEEYDESHWARAVAKELGTYHHEIRLTGQIFRDHLGEALDGLDQPTFDGLNTFSVSRAVRDAGITVAVAGTGGDELFGGYGSFNDLPRARRWSRSLSCFPQAISRLAAKLVTRLKMGAAGIVPPQMRWGKLSDVFSARGDLLALYQCSYSLFTKDFQAELIESASTVDVWHGLPKDVADNLRAETASMSDLECISALELSLFLRERLLRDTDAASMAVSLEVRVPLIDHHVIESLSRVAPESRFLPVFKKQILRDAALSQLAPGMFDREKYGFELPLGVWCREVLRDDMESTLRNADLCRSVGLSPTAVGRLWDAFQAHAPGIDWYRIWAIYILLWWCRRYGFSL